MEDRLVGEQRIEEVRQRILAETKGLVARYLNKKISLPISTWLARNTKVRPNWITYFNIAVGVMTFPFAAHGKIWSLAVAGVILQLASILDGVDGEVAKFTGQSTRWGQWLDTISDNLTHLLFFAGVSVGLHRLYPEAPVAKLSVITFAGFILIVSMIVIFLKRDTESGSFVTYDKEFLGKIRKEDFPIAARLVHSLKYLIKKDFFSFLFFIMAVAGKPLWILYTSSFGVCVASFFIVYMSGVRRVRRLFPSEELQEV